MSVATIARQVVQISDLKTPDVKFFGLFLRTIFAQTNKHGLMVCEQ